MGQLPGTMAGAYERVREAREERQAAALGTGPAVASVQENGVDAVQEQLERDHVDFVRRGKRQTTISKDVLQGAEYQKSLGVVTKIPVFGTRYFATFHAFLQVFFAYCAQHFVFYRREHSVGRESANTKRVAAGYPPIPEEFTHGEMKFYCTHGCVQAPRGTGEREQQRSRFFYCRAEIRAKVEYLPREDRWYVVTSCENRTHNHYCNLDTYSAKMTSSNIPDPELCDVTANMLRVQGNNRLVLEKIVAKMPFSMRQLQNFKSYRMGGPSAEEGANGLLTCFDQIDGNDVLFVEDQAGQTIGILTQSRAQKILCAEYGDSLVLDWTHNTNNLGYYLGAFVVTTATGKGVSVFDFLCLTQSQDMMRAVFTHFDKTNPGLRKRLKSVVIDKDYREWRVLEEVFPNASVVLCQFHVLKWMAHIVNDPKYALPLALRVQVLACFSAMLYASSVADFTHQQVVLAHLLAADQHQLFLKYLHDRWYNCAKMWANHLRGGIFTACNTTSNRIEAFWRQFKEGLGRKHRIDLCVEAVLRRATEILTREKKFLVQHTVSVFLRAAHVPFLESLMRDLSDYTYMLVRKQWDLYSSAVPGSFERVARECTHGGRDQCLTVRVTGRRVVDFTLPASSVDFTVDTRRWECDCLFFRGTLLPCRHSMFVCDAVLEMPQYPASALAPRWSMAHVARLIGDLTQTIDVLSTLRLDKIQENGIVDRHGHTAALQDGVAAAGRSLGSVPLPTESRFAFVQLRRNERSNCVLINDLEKRHIMASHFDMIMSFLQDQGAVWFREFALDFEETAIALVEKWKKAKKARRALPATQPLPAGVVDLEEEKCSESSPADASGYDVLSGYDFHEQQDVDECVDEQHDVGNGGDELDVDEGGDEHDVYELETVDNWRDFHVIDEERACEEDFEPIQHSLSAAEVWRQQQSQTSREADRLLAVVGYASAEQMLEDTTIHSVMQQALGDPDLFEDNMEQWESLVARDGGGRRVVEALSTSVQHNDSANVGWGKRKAIEMTDPNDKRPRPHSTSALNLPERQRCGSVRVATRGKAGHKRGQVERVDLTCPVILVDFVFALLYSLLPLAAALHPRYPEYFHQAIFKTRDLQIRLELEGQIRAMEKLNFFVPGHVLLKIKAIFATTAPASSVVDLVEGSRRTSGPRKEYVARFTSQYRGFTRGDLLALSDFDQAVKDLLSYEKTIERLTTSTYWCPSGAFVDIPFLSTEAAKINGGSIDDPYHTSGPRMEIKRLFESVTLESTITLPGRGSMLGLVQDLRKQRRIRVRDVLGRLALEEWLNDSVVNFALNMLARSFPDVVLVDSLNIDKLVVPEERLRSTRVVIFPMCFAGTDEDTVERRADRDTVGHWGAVVVKLDWNNGMHTAYIYDSDRLGTWERRLVGKGHDWCKGRLTAWNERDEEAERLSSEVVDVTGYVPSVRPMGSVRMDCVTSPKQTDGHSCGIHVVLFAYRAMMGESMTGKTAELSEFAVYVVRLRVMWLVLCNGQPTCDSSKVEKVSRTAEVFAAYGAPPKTKARTQARKKGKGTASKYTIE